MPTQRIYRLSLQTPPLTPHQLGHILLSLPEGCTFIGLDGPRPTLGIDSPQPVPPSVAPEPAPTLSAPSAPPVSVALHSADLVTPEVANAPAIPIRRARKVPTPSRVHLHYPQVPVTNLLVFQKLAATHDGKLDIFRLPGVSSDTCSVVVNFPRSAHYTAETSRDRFEEAYKFAPLNADELFPKLRTVSDASAASLVDA